MYAIRQAVEEIRVGDVRPAFSSCSRNRSGLPGRGGNRRGRDAAIRAGAELTVAFRGGASVSICRMRARTSEPER
jgi:hypothetical protein